MKQGGPVPSQARIAIILGGIGTALLALAVVAEPLTSILKPKSPAPIASPTPATSTVAPAGPSEDELRARRARDATTLEGARVVAKEREKLDAAMASAEHALATHQVGKARRGLDGLSPTFVSLDRIALLAVETTDAEARETLKSAGEILSRFAELRRAVEAAEHAVFDSAFETLWEPKNARKDEEQLYAAVGKKYGLTAAEVQAIYRRNEAEADRRLKARGDAESRELNSKRR